MKAPRPFPRNRGFAQAGTLVQDQVRIGTESRGFAVARVLTHWAEIVGADLAAIARPVDVSFGRAGLGATLTILTTGPQGPIVEMQKDQIRDKVNACYGYRAISKVRITQTARTGFAEGKVDFQGKARAPAPPSPEIVREAEAVANAVNDPQLRLALAALATNVLSKQKR